MLIIRFYQTERGRKPVEEFIDSQQQEVQVKIRRTLKMLSREFPDTSGVGTRHLGGKLWEIRRKISGRHYRIIYAVVAREMIILHCFIKKRRRAQDEIEIASRRLKNYIEGITK